MKFKTYWKLFKCWNDYKIFCVMGEWNHGLFACFDDMATCIITYFIPCVTYANNARESDTLNCCVAAIIFFIPIANILFWVKMRSNIREKYGIDGNMFMDFCTIMLCPLCALVQEEQQLDYKSNRNAAPVIRR